MRYCPPRFASAGVIGFPEAVHQWPGALIVVDAKSPPASVPVSTRPSALGRVRSWSNRAILGIPWHAWGSFIAVFVFLLPARAAALRGDDEWTFEEKGLLELQHHSVWSRVGHDVSQGVLNLRPQLFAKVTSDLTLWIFFGHPVAYRIFLILLTVACAVLLWRLVVDVGASPGIASFVILLFAAAVQFRSYHDPVLGYYGATQWGFVFLLAALLCFTRSLRGDGHRWAALTVLFFFLSCLCQEFMYTTALAFVLLAFTQRRGWSAVRAAAPTVIIALALLLVGYLSDAGVAASAVVPGYGDVLTPHVVLGTWATEMFDPIMGSNRLFSEGTSGYFYPLGTSPTPAEMLAAVWRGLVLLVAVVGFGLGLARSRATPRASAGAPLASGSSLAPLVALGAALWISPPLLVGLSQKYQLELTAGKGYVDVLLQEAGFALIVAPTFIALCRLASRRSRAAMLTTVGLVAALIGFAAGVNGFNNIRVIGLEQPTAKTQELLQSSAEDGAFDALPRRATLLFSMYDMRWPTGSWAYGGDAGLDFMYAWTHREFDFRTFADDTPMTCARGRSFPWPQCAPPSRSSSFWVRVRAYPGGGVVILSHLLHATPKTIGTAPATYLTVFIEGQAANRPPDVLGKTPRGGSWRLPASHWHRVAHGGDWSIFNGTFSPDDEPVAYSLNDPRSPVNFAYPPAPDTLVRWFGASSLLP